MLFRLVYSSVLLSFLALMTACAIGKVQPHYASHHDEIAAWQQELDAEFANPSTPPLKAEDLEGFEGLEYFPIDSTYRVVARVVRIADKDSLEMATTSTRISVYDVYAELHFELQGKPQVLEVYQSHQLRETRAYANYLFLPFRDPTNGRTTYGGGRYMDLEIPEGDTMVLDFNKAYNPYCAYASGFSCPLVPPTNRLSVQVLAGVKAYEK